METNVNVIKAVYEKVAAQEAEIERLRDIVTSLKGLRACDEHEIEEWHHCARYDAMMDGPRFAGWDRSALDRCRKEFIEKRVNEQNAVSRCEVTGNPVGTDTWMVGHDCQCGPCQRMLREGAAAR